MKSFGIGLALGLGLSLAGTAKAAPATRLLWPSLHDSTHAKPYGIALDADNDRVWETNYGLDTVSVRSAADGELLRELPVGAKPYGVALDATRNRAYVVNSGDHSVTRFESDSFTLQQVIQVGPSPRVAAVDGPTGRVWVSNGGDRTISVYNPDTCQVRSLDTGAQPFGIAIDQQRRLAYVANYGEATLSVFQADSLEPRGKINVAPGPMFIAIDEDSNTLCVSHPAKNLISLLKDGGSGETSQVEVSGYPTGLAVDTPRHRVLVTSFQSHALTEVQVDSGRILDRCETSTSPFGVAVNPATGRLYVAGIARNTLDAIDFGEPPVSEANPEPTSAPNVPAFGDANQTPATVEPTATPMPTPRFSDTPAAGIQPAERPEPMATVIAAPPVAQSNRAGSPENSERIETPRNRPQSSAAIALGTLPPAPPKPAAPAAGNDPKSAEYALQQMKKALAPATITMPNVDSEHQIPPMPVPSHNVHGGTYGGTKPWVAASGHRIESLFGIHDIGGVGERGRVSDHPNGLALDFMVYSNKTAGDQIAAYFQQHAVQENVKYVIWQQRIWNPYHGWKLMPDRGSPTENHMDHVHVSYNYPHGLVPATPAHDAPIALRAHRGSQGMRLAEAGR